MGKSRDYWVVNFGLHYSLTYKEELEQLTAEVLHFIGVPSHYKPQHWMWKPCALCLGAS